MGISETDRVARDRSDQPVRTVRRKSLRPIWFGFAIGVSALIPLYLGSWLGVAWLTPLGFLFIPGAYVYLVVYSWCGGSGSLFFGGGGGTAVPSHLAWIPPAVGVATTVLLFGSIGAILGAIFRWRRHKKLVLVATCRQCGFVWSRPLESQCPECGDQAGFDRWMEKPLADHQCAKCGFDLRGNADRRCPECGTTTAPISGDIPYRPRRRGVLLLVVGLVVLDLGIVALDVSPSVWTVQNVVPATVSLAGLVCFLVGVVKLMRGKR